MKTKPWIDGIAFEAEGVGAGVADKPAADAPKPADAAADVAKALYGDAPADKKVDEPAKSDADKPTDKTADKPADEKKDDGKPQDVKPDEVPEDGKYTFTLKDGMEVDAAFAEKAMSVLKELNLSRANADKLANFYAEARAAEIAGLQEQWDKTQAGWIESAKADKEFGGEKFDVSLAKANNVLSKHGTPELIEYLKASGGGNHPEMIRFMARVGNAFSDDKPLGSSVNPAREKSLAEKLYPNEVKG